MKVMKRALLSTLLLLSVCACSDRSSDAASYKKPLDRFVVQLGFGFGYAPCYRREKDAFGEVMVFIGSEQCFRFDPPELMQGIWLDEFESSEFFPNATEMPAERPFSRDNIWLDFTRPEPLLAGRTGDQALAIEFVGRRATFPGSYGHMGMSRHLIVVDELRSATPVPPPTRP
ncbi:MAG: hypothetical protein FJ335_07720 [Sphingomonadales bacterium]|nr:hypothetical protein [Sphingomonadales bacterium]